MMKNSGKAFVLSSLLVLGATSVFAEEAPYATYNIRLENNPVLSEVTPAATSTAPVTKDNVAFRIWNNTGNAAYFVNGDQKTYIPVVSQTTVTVPYSTKEFKAVGEAGNTLATWHVASEKVGKADVASATSEQFAQWGQQLETVKQNAQNRTVSYTWEKREPAQAAPAAPVQAEQGRTVRGFW